MYFDTHAHYDDARFDGDREAVLASVRQKGVGLILNPGSDGPSSQKAVDYARGYDFIYAAVGWHPHEAESFSPESERLLRDWASDPKVRAIGEIGLDYYYDRSERPVQREVFRRQMALALELKLPVIIHDRDAHGECLEIIREFPGPRGVFHCYSGSAETARLILDLGWYLSFTGAITFKKARKAPEVLRLCPMDRLMLETDAPYLAPEPFRGRRNDSGLLPYIAEVVAKIKGLSVETVAARTLENGKRFFGIA